MDKRELLEKFLKGNQLSSTELETVIEWIEGGNFDEIFSEKLDELRPVFDGQLTDWESEDLRNQLFKKLQKVRHRLEVTGMYLYRDIDDLGGLVLLPPFY